MTQWVIEKIKVERKCLEKACAGDRSAMDRVIKVASEPFWKYVSDWLHLDRSTEQHVRRVWGQALDNLRRALQDADIQQWCSEEGADSEGATFQEQFTKWAKGIADDTVVNELIQAFKRREDWAWRVIRERHVGPLNNVPDQHRDDVKQDILLKLYKALNCETDDW